MIVDQRWLYAAIAVVAGFAVGAFLAAAARRILGSEQRKQAIQAVAKPTATFLFWLAAATGLITAIGFTSPDTLRPIPADILAWLPGALAAGLILLAGYAGGAAISTAAGAAAQRATQQRPTAVERAIRWVVMAAATVLALGNLGVQTTSLLIIVAAVAASVGLTFALLAGLGGREVAANIASGRTLRSELKVGDHLETGDVSGRIAALRPAVVVIEAGDDARIILPLSILLDRPFRVTASTAARPTTGHR